MYMFDRYSLQLAIKYKKYYKSLSLGLVDLAVVDAYIVHNARRAGDRLRKLSHVKLLKQLHLELCQLREEDWEWLRSTEDAVATPAKSPQTDVRLDTYLSRMMIGGPEIIKPEGRGAHACARCAGC
jgi:hypothetical protein